MEIAFYGSSLLSSYWNGAATYYRGILRALAQSGHSITFFEPDAYDRQKHRDIPDPEWARIVVYNAEDRDEVDRHLAASARLDVVVKASGVGVLDELVEARVAAGEVLAGDGLHVRAAALHPQYSRFSAPEVHLRDLKRRIAAAPDH